MAENEQIEPSALQQDAVAPLLSILIVNFNGKHFLPECLLSLRKHVTVSHEIIMVDNASSDGSVEYVRQAHPEVKIVYNRTNLGFAAGNNQGARVARGRYSLLLNNDTVVRSISPLIARMESDAHIGVLGCRLLYGDGCLQESIGYSPSVLSLVLSWTPLWHLFPSSKIFRRTVVGVSGLYQQEYTDVDWVSGACLLTRSALWGHLGGLDEKYFMYMEEVDYCRRVRSVGLRVGYSCACQVTHFEGAGRPWVGESALLSTADSYMVYVSKFHGRVAVLVLRLLMVPVFMMRSLAFWAVYMVRIDSFGAEKGRAFFMASLKLIRGYARQ